MSTRGRLYRKGRPTRGWAKARRVERLSDVRVGDVLIVVSPQFHAENLVRVTDVCHVRDGFTYMYVNHRSLSPLSGYSMFVHAFALRPGHEELSQIFYRTVDHRWRWRRVPARMLPSWTYYPSVLCDY